MNKKLSQADVDKAFQTGLSMGRRISVELLQHFVNRASEGQFDLKAAGLMELPVVRIEIRGGCLAEVAGLLPGQYYELIDHDNLEEEDNAEYE